jgi:D-sedoheptulose 7-phosphate isomerase
MNKIESLIKESIRVKELIIQNHINEIEEISDLWIETIQNGNKILFCGNGGSAGDSQHIATELIVRLRSDNNRPAIAAIALTTDTSLLTAAANDLGFDYIFSRQVEGIANDGDLLVLFSTSGNSQNLVEAVKAADIKGVKSVALLGKDGGKLKNMVNHSIVVPHSDAGRIQESHIMIGHILSQLLEEKIHG